MTTAILDADSYGDDIDLSGFNEFGEVTFYSLTTRSEVKERIRDVDVAVINNVAITNGELDSAKHLKLIAIAATGMDNVDLDYCKEKNIMVKNVKGYATESVAQHTFAMLFHLLEQTTYFDTFTKDGSWSKSGNAVHFGKKFMQISGKRWGIIGMGAIGKRVAEIASVFGCEVVYYKRENGKTIPGYKGLTLDNLLQTSAIVSVHTPLNNSTRGLLSDRKLTLLKKGAILLNLGRGGIVDEIFLSEAIERNDIRAGLDVFSTEPLGKDHPLLKVKRKENLLMTPHMGFAAVEARQDLISKTINNIREAGIH